MNVLVIDTDPAVRRLIGDVLLPLDEWELLEAQDATTATAVMQDREADLILLDVALPDLPEVSQVIANLRYLRPHLPVIGLSIAAEPKLSDPLVTAGVSQIIPKAFHAEQFHLFRARPAGHTEMCTREIVALPVRLRVCHVVLPSF